MADRPETTDEISSAQPATVQERFDAIIKELPGLTLRHRMISEISLGGRDGDTLSVMWSGGLSAQIHLRGIGEVARAKSDHTDAGRVALWRDLRLSFLDWQERQAAAPGGRA